MDRAKPFCIAKREVWEAYKRVKANHGAAGVDGPSIAEFEENLSNNLYRLWNRMSSGSYMPPPVRRVAMDERDRWEFPLSPTESLRRLSNGIWSPFWNLSSMRTPTGIGPGAQRMMHWRWHGSDAGAMTGCSISTSRVSSIISIGAF